MKKEGNEVALAQLHKLAEDISLTVDELSKAMGLTRRNSCKQTQTLNLSPDKSERIQMLMKIMAQAAKLHRGKSEAARWMKSPVPALRGRTPLECAATLDGLSEVESLLIHFDEVVYFRRPRAARTSAPK